MERKERKQTSPIKFHRQLYFPCGIWLAIISSPEKPARNLNLIFAWQKGDKPDISFHLQKLTENNIFYHISNTIFPWISVSKQDKEQFNPHYFYCQICSNFKLVCWKQKLQIKHPGHLFKETWWMSREKHERGAFPFPPLLPYMTWVFLTFVECKFVQGKTLHHTINIYILSYSVPKGYFKNLSKRSVHSKQSLQ